MVVLTVTEPQPQFARVALTDYLPAGFEIDNPRLVSSGDTGTLDWIEHAGNPVHTEFRDDRFTAAFERRKDDPTTYSVAYIVRAVSPGSYVLPQAVVEDMYRPDRFGRTETGAVEVSPAKMNQREQNLNSPLRGEVGAHGAPGEGNQSSLTVAARSPRPSPHWGEGVGGAGARSMPRGSVWLRRGHRRGMGRVRRARSAAARARPRSVARSCSTGTANCSGPIVTSEGRWRLAATREDVDPRFLEALLAYEDKRFFQHRGVDPFAMMRAAYQFVTNGHIVSGGSTHDHAGRPPARAAAKAVGRCQDQAGGARHRARMGAQQGRDSRALSDAGALWRQSRRHKGGLVTPISARSRAGSRSAKRRSWWRCRNRRSTAGPTASPTWPSARATACSTASRAISPFGDAEIAHAKDEPVPSSRKSLPLIAPHAADQAVMASPQEKVLRLTIDARLQKTLESLARERAQALGRGHVGGDGGGR